MVKTQIYGGFLRNRYPVRCRIYDGNGTERFDRGRYKREKTKDTYFQFKGSKLRIPAPDFQFLVPSDLGYVIYFKQASPSEIQAITFDELTNKTPAQINYGVASWLAEENKRATLRWRKQGGLMAIAPYLMLGIFFFIIVIGTLMYNNANVENMNKLANPLMTIANNLQVSSDNLAEAMRYMYQNNTLANVSVIG